MGQARKEVPRWRRKQPAGPQVRLSRKAEAALTRRLLEQMPATQGHPAAVSAPPRKGGGGVLARSGAYRFRRQLIPVGWLAVVLAAGPGFHHAGKPQDGLLIGLAGALAVFLGSRHLKGRSKTLASVLALLTATWVPVLSWTGMARPWPFLAVLSWAVLQGFWSHHYRWRPEEPERKPRYTSDPQIWEERIAAKRLKGTYLAEQGEITGGRTWTVMLPGGDLVPADVMANEARIAGAWDKPKTEVFVEPYPDGRQSRCKLTILKRDALATVRKWDGAGVDPETGCAVIGRFADGSPARVRFYARRDGTRHGLIAGTSGSGKTYLLDLIVRLALTSGRIVPVILDPQNGQSLPQWRGKVPYASGIDECTVALQCIRDAMFDRSSYLSSLKWADETGHEWNGMDYFDPFMTGLPAVLVIADESPMLLTGDGREEAKRAARAVYLAKEIGKLGRKTGVALWPVAQVPSLEELGSQVVRSMLAGGNIISLRTADRVSGGMLGIAADPSEIPRYFADGSETYGLGFVIGPDARQAPARIDLVSMAHRRQEPEVPAFDPRFAAFMDRAFTTMTQAELPVAEVPAVSLVPPLPDEPADQPGRACADAILGALRDGGQMDRKAVKDAIDGLAREWGRPKPWGIRALGDALNSLTAAGTITKVSHGVYALPRASLQLAGNPGSNGKAG